MTLGKNFILKALLDIFFNIESTKDKMLETDPDLERSVAICKGMLARYCVLNNKKASPVQMALDEFLQSNKTLILNASDIF